MAWSSSLGIDELTDIRPANSSDACALSAVESIALVPITIVNATPVIIPSVSFFMLFLPACVCTCVEFPFSLLSLFQNLFISISLPIVFSFYLGSVLPLLCFVCDVYTLARGNVSPHPMNVGFLENSENWMAYVECRSRYQLLKVGHT